MLHRPEVLPVPRRTSPALGAAVPGAALSLSIWGAVRLVTGDGPGRAALDIAGVDVGLYLDVLSVVLLPFVAGLSWLVVSYSARNARGQSRAPRLVGLQAVTTLGLVVLVAGASLPVMAAGWTVSGLSLAAMVAHAGTPTARRAARYVRRRLLVGDASLWAAVCAAVIALPTVDRADLPSADLPPAATTVVALLLVLACVPRSALVPAHRWLPETAEAPSPVSALLHAGLVNGVGVVLSLMWPLLSAAPAALVLLLAVGVSSVLWGTVGARLRGDAKGRLAASTTAQMGYTAVQLGLGLPAAAVLHVLGHGLWKSWLFLRAGGTATRARAEATADPPPSPRRGAWPAVAAVAAVLVLGWVPLRSSWSQLGPVVLVPLLLTLAALATATWAAGATRPGRVPPTAPVQVAAAGLLTVAASAYLWAVTGAELLLASSLPPSPAWSPVVAVAFVAALLGFAAGVLLVLRQGTGPPDPLIVLMAAEAVAPWHRRLGGHRRAPEPRGTTAASRIDIPEAVSGAVSEAVSKAAADLAPAWPLRAIVAANPMARLERLPFEEAARTAIGLIGADGLMTEPDYLRRLREGRIRREDLVAAVQLRAADTGRALTPSQAIPVVEALVLAAERDDCPTSGPAVDPTAATGGPGPHQRRDAHASLWCQRAWVRAQGRGPGPWQLFRAHAVSSAYDVAVGLRGAGRFVHSLPADPHAVLGALLAREDIAGPAAVRYLRSLLLAGPGWTAHALWRARQDGDEQALVELLALRACLDRLAAGDAPPTPDPPPVLPLASGDPAPDTRHVWQLAYELHYAERLVTALREPARRLAVSAAADPAGADVVRVQWVACLDVRSERLRRHLEHALGEAVETVGFAGFFGVDLDHRPAGGGRFELCPAIVRPGVTSRTAQTPTSVRHALATGVAAAGQAPFTPLVLAEVAGPWAGAAAAGRTALPTIWGRISAWWSSTPDPWGAPGLQLEADSARRAALAAGALRGMGLTSRLAPLVVLGGHGATLQNNAFASAYDCGACGGSSGSTNARALAGLLNDPQVRADLATDGVVVPEGTFFLAALHDTTTDDVVLDPLAVVPGDRAADVARLQDALSVAGAGVRLERASHLPGLAPVEVPARGRARLRARVHARAQDWAQPFPEWGLAGNAAIVVGSRALTRGLDLGGRVFLHSYDASADTDGTLLDAVLTAPVVVAHWISCQYRVSTVAPDVLGSGDKTTHNVVGDVGVLSGAHGDLRLGLPWQSVSGAEPGPATGDARHEPMRLLVVVHAPPERVLASIRRHTELCDLVGNGWLRVGSIDPADGSAHLLSRCWSWQAYG